jgi:hypothetical protein
VLPGRADQRAGGAPAFAAFSVFEMLEWLLNSPAGRGARHSRCSTLDPRRVPDTRPVAVWWPALASPMSGRRAQVVQQYERSFIVVLFGRGN